MRYMNCVRCGKKLYEGETIVRYKPHTGSYCSYRCAALNTGYFNEEKFTDTLVSEDSTCNNDYWKE